MNNYTFQFNFCHFFYRYIALLFRLKFAQRQIEWTLMDSTLKNIYSRADCFCTMIDWVSIVRHSRRRFSDYMFAVPVKIRKRRRARRHTDPKSVLPDDRDVNNAISRDSENGGNVCECCWSHVSSGQNFALVAKKMFFFAAE